MKKYENPELNVLHVELTDVITTSGEITGGNASGNTGGSGQED